MKLDRYEQSVKFVESLVNIPGPSYLKNGETGDRSFFIKRLRFLLNLLDNPQNDFKFVHITGTSGKTSLSCMIQSILSEAGIKCGVTFSPHPTFVTERFKAGEKYISRKEFSDLVDFIKPLLSECSQKSPYGIPSYFETLVAVAFLYFKKQKCQYAILESGLGGSFDATNVIEKNEMAIITNIGLDHMDILGENEKEIALDKAEIIKPGSILLTGEEKPEILEIFEKKCAEKKCQMKKINFDYQCKGCDYNGNGFIYEKEKYQTKLVGEHQIGNAIIAIEAVKYILGEEKIPSQKISKAIKNGLKKAFYPCRLELIQKNPRVILDGAHNPDKMKTTAEFMKRIKKDSKIHLVISLAENKNLLNTFRSIIPLVSNVYLTRFLVNERKVHKLSEMEAAALKINSRLKGKIVYETDPFRALEKALEKAGKNDIILITGSFFLAGELRKKWL